MNICILHRYPLSEIKGTNPSLPYFLRELIKGGHKVFVVTFAKRFDKYPIKDFEFYPLNFQFNRAKTIDKWLKSLLFILITPFKVRNLNLRYRFNIVYCDDSLPFYAYLIKIISGVPSIMRLGDLQSAYLFYNRGLFAKLTFRFIHWFEKFTWKKIDKIIVISKSFKKFLIKEGIDQDKISVVEESIDIDNFYKNANGKHIRANLSLKDEPLIMFHGLISKIKGVDALLKTTPYVLKEFPEAKIMIVGSGPDLNRLKQLTQRLNISKSVIFTGWVPFSQIPDYIAACNIGVPLRSNNLGNNFVVTCAFLQYSIMSKPVVCPKLSAFVDIFKDTEKSFLFKPGNPRELSERIVELLKAPDLSREIGGYNRKLVSSRFSAQKVARELYSALFSRKRL